MISVILDHPWPIAVDRDPSSKGFGVLRKFVDLVRKHRLAVQPFIQPQEFLEADCWSAPHTSALAAVRRSARSFVRWSGGDRLAVPQPEPPNISHFWKCALADAMSDPSDWRCPQVLVCAARRPQWPNGAEVRIDLQGDEHEHFRVIAVVEDYDDHPYALSDTDPWNQSRFHPVGGNARPEGRECFLPKPPNVDTGRSVEELDQMVDFARRMCNRWELDGKYYFIPPPGWRASNLDKDDWRNDIFDVGSLNGRNGPIDHKDRVWSWAERHGHHWDLELPDGSHLNINQRGDQV